VTLDLFHPTSETQKDIINSAIVEAPPHNPGVYTMYNANDKVLYVGKAKNLHKRITSYRYSKSKKTQRMIAHISRIGFEVCKTETDAILLENLLIRSLRPPFNTVNKKPETYYYISTIRSGNKREFRLSMRQLEDYPRCYGCFKGHNRVRKGLGALLKFLYMMDKPIESAHYLPAQLVGRIAPMQFRVRHTDELGVMVHQLLEGSSSFFLDECTELVNTTNFVDRFTSKYFEKELENLSIFYALGPERNHQMKTTLGLDYSLIPQDQLDDLQVLFEKQTKELV